MLSHPGDVWSLIRGCAFTVVFQRGVSNYLGSGSLRGIYGLFYFDLQYCRTNLENRCLQNFERRGLRAFQLGYYGRQRMY